MFQELELRIKDGQTNNYLGGMSSVLSTRLFPLLTYLKINHFVGTEHCEELREVQYLSFSLTYNQVKLMSRNKNSTYST